MSVTSEVLVEVSHCGVCGSDLHLVLDGWGRRGSIGGHEWSGVVCAVGDDVTRWSVGDEVIGGPTPRCGRCEMCRSGHPTLCSERDTPGTGGGFQGAFARYTKVDERELLRVPDGLTLREAALAEPLAVALHGITNSGATPGQRVLVLGAGPIGALTIAALRAMGIDDIKVSEPAPVRQELARRLGRVGGGRARRARGARPVRPGHARRRRGRRGDRMLRPSRSDGSRARAAEAAGHACVSSARAWRRPASIRTASC